MNLILLSGELYWSVLVSESYKEIRLNQLQRKHSLVLNPLSICKYFAYIFLSIYVIAISRNFHDHLKCL